MTNVIGFCVFFFFSSRRRHTRFDCDWSSDVCSSDLRMILLGKLGRLDDARRIADSLWGVHYFGGELFATVPAMTEAYAWATNLFAAAGDFERVRAALAAFSARLAVRLEPAQAYAATVTLLSGSESGPVAPVVLPDGLRRSVREALRAELARYPGDPLLSAWLRTSASFPNR